ncbi:hypothetical protein ElyMa_000431700 [Elysia marginata]|uniref:Uncharacterized protein n=1 Tax=Elysia marginata TaxID=1093978 RepID=A0AAV4FMH9_9GAST|nr:hypothetical protein ElyMa_000431700 [Elysia marginata]
MDAPESVVTVSARAAEPVRSLENILSPPQLLRNKSEKAKDKNMSLTTGMAFSSRELTYAEEESRGCERSVVEQEEEEN